MSSSDALALPVLGERTHVTGATIRTIASTIFRRLIAIVVVLLVWEIAPRLHLVDNVFLPPFSSVADAWWSLVLDGTMYENLQASLVRALSGFGLALVIGVPLGLLIGWYGRLAELLDPLIELFRNTAALALLPVFILILGIGQTSKIAIVLYACIWPILLNTISAVRNVDPLFIKSARSMGLSPFRLFQKVILPASLPTIFTGVRLAGAHSILILIAAEMVGATAGLGFYVTYAQNNFQIPQMYACIITISVLGLAFNYALVRLERHFSSWKS